MHSVTFNGREYHFVDYLSLAAYRRVQKTIAESQNLDADARTDALVDRMLLEGLRKPDGSSFTDADEVTSGIGFAEYEDIVKHCEKVLSFETPSLPLASTTDSATP